MEFSTEVKKCLFSNFSLNFPHKFLILESAHFTKKLLIVIQKECPIFPTTYFLRCFLRLEGSMPSIIRWHAIKVEIHGNVRKVQFGTYELLPWAWSLQILSGSGSWEVSKEWFNLISSLRVQILCVKTVSSVLPIRLCLLFWQENKITRLELEEWWCRLQSTSSISCVS